MKESHKVTAFSRWISILGILLVSLLLFTLCGCKATIMYSGSNVGNKITGSYQLFNGTKTATIDVDAGKTLIVHYTSEVKKGKLTIELFNSVKESVSILETNTAGTKSFTPGNHEDYELDITGDDTEGSFDVHWETAEP